MRVLHVVAHSQRRGAETAAIELAAEFVRRGEDHRVVALHAAFDGEVDAAVPVIGRGRALRAEVRRSDLVVAHGGEAAEACALVVGRSGPPIVWQRILGLPAGLWSSALQRRRWAWVDRRCAAVVALTEDLAAEQVRLSRTAGTGVIPNFRDPAPFAGLDPMAAGAALRAELGVGPDTALIGLVGHLIGQKRPIRAVGVLARVAGAGIDAHLVVAGTGPLADDLRAALDGAGLADRATLLGHRGDVPRLLAGLDVLVLVSEDEGIPGILVEAQLAGCPTITVDVGGVAEIVTDGVTGLVVPGPAGPGDGDGIVDAVGDAVAGLLADPDRRAAMRAAALAGATRFGVAAAADRYAEGFTGLLGG